MPIFNFAKSSGFRPEMDSEDAESVQFFLQAPFDDELAKMKLSQKSKEECDDVAPKKRALK